MENNIQLSEIEEIKAQLNKLSKENEMLKLFNGELEATNSHLVAATWRERDMKKKLADTIEELHNTKIIVEAQNKRIAESINYSRKIQNAINPEETQLREYIKDSFILYKPKDVISGDFPWLYAKGRYLYLAAVDCTGHGVPGAMMSMIGSLLLNDIVNGDKDLTPSEILMQLHLAVVKTLKQDAPGSNSSDGMDLGLCRIDLHGDELLFSGAHRPLLHVRNGEVEQIKGDKFPIGGMQYRGKNNYTDTIIKIEKGDAFYVFSDGLTDQTGGPENKKLMINYVRDITVKYAHIPQCDIKNIFNEEFEKWKGNNKQLDDVILIGFRS
jgi:serine phosphatase RsbU (regulator of sigma subunit)